MERLYYYKAVISQMVTMDPQCEVIGKYVLPIFRSMLAKELVQKYNLSQTQAAKKLGTTQAAVSQYLSSKRAYKGVEHVEQYLPKMQEMAAETAQKLVKDEIATKEVTFDFCSLCATFCIKDSVKSGVLNPEYYI
jgi:predicted transcriptional regulator